MKDVNRAIKKYEDVWNLIISEIQNWPYDFKDIILKTHQPQNAKTIIEV